MKEHWNINNYRATLGHKSNHNFTRTNSRFVGVIHPRYGPIVAVLSTNKIKKGEEVLSSYGYEEGSLVPSWYANTYKQELNQRWPGKYVYDESDEHKPLNLRAN